MGILEVMNVSMKKTTNGYILRFAYESVRFPKIGCDDGENCYNKVL